MRQHVELSASFHFGLLRESEFRCHHLTWRAQNPSIRACANASESNDLRAGLESNVDAAENQTSGNKAMVILTDADGNIRQCALYFVLSTLVLVLCSVLVVGVLGITKYKVQSTKFRTR